MGFYDYGCALTGLSLVGQQCDLLLVRTNGSRRDPLWGLVTGSYNRLGTIDDPAADDPSGAGLRAEIAYLKSAWTALVEAGRLTHEGEPIVEDGPFFERFEPNRHRVSLDGDRIEVTLFHHRVLALLQDKLPDLSLESLVTMAFADAQPIAAVVPDQFTVSLRRLAALQKFLAGKPIPALAAATQHTPEYVKRTIRDAKKRAPRLREAVEQAEFEDYGAA